MTKSTYNIIHKYSEKSIYILIICFVISANKSSIIKTLLILVVQNSKQVRSFEPVFYIHITDCFYRFRIRFSDLIGNYTAIEVMLLQCFYGIQCIFEDNCCSLVGI